MFLLNNSYHNFTHYSIQEADTNVLIFLSINCYGQSGDVPYFEKLKLH